MNRLHEQKTGDAQAADADAWRVTSETKVVRSPVTEAKASEKSILQPGGKYNSNVQPTASPPPAARPRKGLPGWMGGSAPIEAGPIHGIKNEGVTQVPNAQGQGNTPQASLASLPPMTNIVQTGGKYNRVPRAGSLLESKSRRRANRRCCRLACHVRNEKCPVSCTEKYTTKRRKIQQVCRNTAAWVGQGRKPLVRRQPFSHASRASSPYTGEPFASRNCVGVLGCAL